MTLAGGFAVFHGQAHGAELPAAAGGLGYGIGFVAATAGLHGLGALAAHGISSAAQTAGARITRVCGAAAALAGLGMLTGVV